jgi:hypothetical protein
MLAAVSPPEWNGSTRADVAPAGSRIVVGLQN